MAFETPRCGTTDRHYKRKNQYCAATSQQYPLGGRIRPSESNRVINERKRLLPPPIRHLIVHYSRLTSILEDFHLTETKVFLILPVVSYIDELPRMTQAVVAQEHRLFGLEWTVKLGAYLVHGLVAF